MVWTKLCLCLCLCLGALAIEAAGDHDEQISRFYKRNGADADDHTNNWAVIVCASRFWFNYRHVANALSVYRSVRRFGVPNSQIILMLSDDMACNARNPEPAKVFNDAQHHINVYDGQVEVDYRGYEVTVENFIRLLTGRVKSTMPKSKRLLTNSGSNILIYMTGHGGDGFLKFQDSEELTSIELANAFEQMHVKQRYHEILFIIDTCQAESMSKRIYSPNIVGIGSSRVGEDSLSHHGDSAIGVYVIDRYTYYLLHYIESQFNPNRSTLGEFSEVCPPRHCISHVTVRLDLYPKNPYKVPLRNFFGNVVDLELITWRDQKNVTDGDQDEQDTSLWLPETLGEQPKKLVTTSVNEHSTSEWQLFNPVPSR